MSNSSETDFKFLWQKQSALVAEISLDEIRRRTHSFQTNIRIRNALEYGSAAIVVTVFSGKALTHLERPLFALACGFISAAAIWIVFFIRRHGYATKPPVNNDSRSYLVYLATDLKRQYTLQRNVWIWYLAPFVPGMTLFMATNPGPSKRFSIVGNVLAFVFFFSAALVWNQFFARRLRVGLEQVETMLKGMDKT